VNSLSNSPPPPSPPPCNKILFNRSMRHPPPLLLPQQGLKAQATQRKAPGKRSPPKYAALKWHGSVRANVITPKCCYCAAANAIIIIWIPDTAQIIPLRNCSASENCVQRAGAGSGRCRTFHFAQRSSLECARVHCGGALACLHKKLHACCPMHASLSQQQRRIEKWPRGETPNLATIVQLETFPSAAQHACCKQHHHAAARHLPRATPLPYSPFLP
jgi:hypothetical protein